MKDGGSSVPRRQLGRYLKKAREEAGIALEAAARELEWSRARMYRIEAGQTSVRSHDAIAMCDLYGADEELREVLVGLARESKAKGWWQPYGDVVPSWFELYVSMEAAASQLRQYVPALVPGLLQTPAYAAAVFQLDPGISERDVAQKVALRMERQKLLTRRNPEPPRLEFILDEAVLRRPIGDVDAWREQLAHLSNVVRARRLSVRILQSALGPHRALGAGSFVILDFPRVGVRVPEPTTVYCEGLTGALYLDKPGEVQVHVDIWGTLDALALDAKRSQDLIAEIVKETFDD